jgi:Uma2 family endonuclease
MTAVMPETDHMAMVQSLHDDLEVPDGFRAEIIGGEIVVSASPMGHHAFIVRAVHNAIWPVRPPGCDLYEVTTARTESGQRYIPDLALWPVNIIQGATEWIFPAQLCRFALEVTSPDSEYHDYKKGAGYAESGVPIYLLVDNKQRECIVFTDPKGTAYRAEHRVAFGDPVILPFANPVTIDTSAF